MRQGVVTGFVLAVMCCCMSGICRRAMNDDEGALESFKAALEIDPTYAVHIPIL